MNACMKISTFTDIRWFIFKELRSQSTIVMESHGLETNLHRRGMEHIVYLKLECRSECKYSVNSCGTYISPTVSIRYNKAWQNNLDKSTK